MNRTTLTDKQWDSILVFLLACPQVRVGNRGACRAFLNAVLWILRSGAQWRLLPAELGQWNSVFKRFARWCKLKVWTALSEYAVIDRDLQQVMIDSTVVRAHACAAGARGSSEQDEALGRSRGGFTTKIHVVTDGLGNPLDFVVTGGQVADISQAEALLAPIPAQTVLADKGYDSDALVNTLTERGIDVVIPPRENRVEPRRCDWHVYKERHLVECFFNKIKHYRRVFSRFEKTARNFMGFLRLTAFLIWTR